MNTTHFHLSGYRLFFILIILPYGSMLNYDEFASCDTYYENKRSARVLDAVPCDMQKVSYCKLKGPRYPEAAIWRFKDDNRALIKRLYGDLDSSYLLREMRSSSSMFSGAAESERNRASQALFSSPDYKIRVGSGFAIVKNAIEQNNSTILFSNLIKKKKKKKRKKIKSVVHITTSTSSSVGSTKADSAFHPAPIYKPTVVTAASSTTFPFTVVTESPTSAENYLTHSNQNSSQKESPIQPRLEQEEKNKTFSASNLQSISSSTYLHEQGNDKDRTVLPEVSVSLSESVLKKQDHPSIIQKPDLDMNVVHENTEKVQLNDSDLEQDMFIVDDDYSFNVTESSASFEVKSNVETDNDDEDYDDKDDDYDDDEDDNDDGDNVNYTSTSPPPEESNQIEYIGESVNACDVTEEVIAPYWANNTRNQVLALLNLYPFEQYIHMETCKFEFEEMNCRPGCRCEQQHRLHRLLAFDPTNECRGIFSDWFRLPSYCLCRCYDIGDKKNSENKNPVVTRQGRRKKQFLYQNSPKK